MADKIKLMRVIDPDAKFPPILRDSSGLGWRRFAGGATLVCDSCGKRIVEGFIDTMGHDRRCDECVEVIL